MTKLHTGTISSKHIAISSLLYAGSQFFLMVWISRFYGADNLGLYGLISGLFAPVLSMLSIGQRYDILLNRLISISALSLVGRLFFIALVAIGAVVYQVFISDLSSVFLIFVFAVYKFFDSVFELALWGLQNGNKLRCFMMATFMRVSSVPFVVLFGYLLDLDFSIYLLLLSILSIVGCVFLILFSDVEFSNDLSSDGCKQSLIKWFLPSLSAGVESFVVVFPRYILGWLGDLSSIASYVVATQVSAVIGIFASAKLQADLPKFKSDDSSYVLKKTVLPFFLYFFVFCVAVFLVVDIFPVRFYLMIFGNWFLGSIEALKFVPVLVFAWYGSGYSINFLSSVVGKRAFSGASIVLLVSLFISMAVVFAVGTKGTVGVLLALTGVFMSRFLYFVFKFRGR